MLRPGDAQDIAKLVQFANRQGLKVAMRGQGHSFFGQTQVEGGVVIDSSSLNAVRIVKSGTGGTAEIGPGSKWHPVLMAANAQKLTVPVIADTFLSVGGTISTGGFGVTTYNLGLQVDHVQELEVVTGDGQIVTCSDERNSDLFNAMLGGLGQCGIITKVVMRLMAAPTNVLFIKMDYDDFQSASADLALLAKDGRFHHLDGRGAGRPTGGVGYYVEGGAFYDAPNAPDEAKLTAGLKFAKKTATVMTYEQYFRREEVCGAVHDAAAEAFRLSLHSRHRDTSSTRLASCHRRRSPRFSFRACRRGAGTPSSARSPACRTKRSSTGSSFRAHCRRGPTPRP